MPALTAIYVDFQDPACYRAWRWLSLLPACVGVEVRPYSLDSDNGVRRSPWDRTTRSCGLELLALGEVARDRGPECQRRYVAEAFRVLHEDGDDMTSPESWLALCAAVGIDFTRFIDDSERWRAEVGLWHQEAEDEFDVRGVPSLVFDNGRVLQVTLEEDITEPEAAARLLADLTDLAAQPVQQVRRTA